MSEWTDPIEPTPDEVRHAKALLRDLVETFVNNPQGTDSVAGTMVASALTNDPRMLGAFVATTGYVTAYLLHETANHEHTDPMEWWDRTFHDPEAST